MSLLERVEGKDYDDRSVAEQMRDLGLGLERPNKMDVTRARWIDGPYVQKRTNRITVTKVAIYFPGAMEDLDRVTLGVGQYKGSVVLLVKSDPKGFKLNQLTNRVTKRRAVQVKRAITDLLALGLKPGLYEPVKVKGGWMGVPE